MWAADTVAIVCLTFLLAGAIKGVVGLGLPSVSLGILTVFFGLQPAMALMLVPSIVTNIWQACVGGRLIELLRRFRLFLLSAAVGILLGVEILAGADADLLARLLGLLLAAYAVLGLTTPKLSLPSSCEGWAGPVAGAVNGMLTGLTGSFAVPGVPYLQALGLGRDALVQMMGILFTVSTLALGIALGASGCSPSKSCRCPPPPSYPPRSAWSSGKRSGDCCQRPLSARPCSGPCYCSVSTSCSAEIVAGG